MNEIKSGRIKGIGFEYATDEFTRQGFIKVLKTTSEFVKLEEAEEALRLKQITEVGIKEGAIFTVIWDDVPMEAILIHFAGLYFPQIVLIKNLQKKLDDYFRYLKK